MVCNLTPVTCFNPQDKSSLSTSILLRCMTICSHMKCPFCNQKTKVYNSRSSHQSTQTWRRRQCLSCNKAFTTREKIDFNGLVTVRSVDNPEGSPYSTERLLLSLVRASAQTNVPSTMITELIDSIQLELKKQRFFETAPQDADEITATATAVIARYDINIALAYLHAVHKGSPPVDILKSIVDQH